MKKTLLVIGGILVVLAGIWVILWNAGKEEVFARMDAEIRALDTAGTRISFAGRDVSGFPFGYTVMLQDVVAHLPDSGSTFRLPEVTSSADLSDPDRLVTRIPETFELEIVPTDAMKQADPALADQYLVEFETIAAELVVNGRPDTQRQIELTAESLLGVHTDASLGTSVAIELQDVASTSELPARIDAGTTVTTGRIGFVDYVVRGAAESGTPVTIEGQTEDIRFSGTSTVQTAADIQALFEGTLQGRVEATFGVGSSISRFVAEGSEDSPGGSLETRSGTSSGTVALDDGSVVLRGESRNNSWHLVTEADALVQEATVQIEMFDGIYQVPLSPSDAMRPFEVKFAMIDMTLDEALWSVLDPDGEIDRAPAQLLIDTVGTMRLTKPQSEMRTGEAPPVAFGNLSVNKLDLSILGAQATARGDVEFIQPINLPQGTMTLRLKNALEVMSRLVAAEVLTPDVLLFASLMAQNYLLEDPESGELVGEFEMGPGGITVNGQPLQ
ncbi:MAG: DUF2125 domain-containing protein [Pseudomonadota bacterium]